MFLLVNPRHACAEGLQYLVYVCVCVWGGEYSQLGGDLSKLMRVSELLPERLALLGSYLNPWGVPRGQVTHIQCTSLCYICMQGLFQKK